MDFHRSGRSSPTHRFTNTNIKYVRVEGSTWFVKECEVPAAFPVDRPEERRPSTPCGAGRVGGEATGGNSCGCRWSRDGRWRKNSYAHPAAVYTRTHKPFIDLCVHPPTPRTHTRTTVHAEGDTQRRGSAGAKSTPNRAVFAHMRACALLAHIQSIDICTRTRTRTRNPHPQPAPARSATARTACT